MDKPTLGQQIATSGDGMDITRPWVGALSQPSDPLLRKAGTDVKIYEELLSDWQVKAMWQQRQRAVVSREWQVDAGGDRPIDIAAADHLREQLNRVGWDRVTERMLYGVYYGYAVSEIIYGHDDRYITWEAIKVRNRRRFRYTPAGELRLLTPNNMVDGVPCPEPYFWHYATGADHDDEPYGMGLAHWLYWPVLFKRNGVKFWLFFLDKYGMPTAKGEFDPKTATEDDKKKLLEAGEAIRTDSTVLIPKGMALELLEAARNGTADYKALYDAMDAAIAKVTVGQVASSQGTPGRLGNDDLQGDVRLDLIKADADLVCESFNNGPVRWLTRWNFPDAELPRVYRVVEEPEDLEGRAERDEKVSRMAGYKPTRHYVEKTYGIELADEPPPAPPTEFAESTAPSDPAEAMLVRTEAQVQPVVDGWNRQLAELAEGGASLDQVRDQLLAMAPELSLDEYAQRMTEALSLAQLAGRNDIEDEVR
ncbi:portal protein [Pseudomonas sp. WN033]|nr:portal protein [Pseudomonas sp. WN033]